MSLTHLKANERSWYPFDVPGVEFTPLHAESDGRVMVLTRFSAGTIGSWHTHPGGEQLYVIDGRADLSGVEISTGDYLYTPPGMGHQLKALTNVVLLLVLPEQPVYEQRAPG